MSGPFEIIEINYTCEVKHIHVLLLSQSMPLI